MLPKRCIVCGVCQNRLDARALDVSRGGSSDGYWRAVLPQRLLRRFQHLNHTQPVAAPTSGFPALPNATDEMPALQHEGFGHLQMRYHYIAEIATISQDRTLMRRAGLRGVCRRKGTYTTLRERHATVATDLVARHFAAQGPDQLWVDRRSTS